MASWSPTEDHQWWRKCLQEFALCLHIEICISTFIFLKVFCCRFILYSKAYLWIKNVAYLVSLKESASFRLCEYLPPFWVFDTSRACAIPYNGTKRNDGENKCIQVDFVYITRFLLLIYIIAIRNIAQTCLFNVNKAIICFSLLLINVEFEQLYCFKPQSQLPRGHRVNINSDLKPYRKPIALCRCPQSLWRYQRHSRKNVHLNDI